MSIRITTSMISKTYKKNANKSLDAYNYYSNRATTKRAFSRTSEDVFSATRAFKVRHESKANEDHLRNVEYAKNFLDTGEGNIQIINKVFQDAKEQMTAAINGTKKGEDRSVYATSFRTIQDSLVSTLNTKYADQYIFGGSDTSKAPFSIVDGELYYRGINVNTGKNLNGTSVAIGSATSVSFGTDGAENLNGVSLTVTRNTTPGATNTVSYDATNNAITVSLVEGATNEDLQNVLRDAFTNDAGLSGLGVDASKITVSGSPTGVASVSKLDDAGNAVASTISDVADLKALAEETMYIDIGLGLDFDSNGKINEQSVFDMSMPGISFLGYGKDADGNNENIFTILSEIADYFEDDSFTTEGSNPYSQRLENAYNAFIKKYTEFGSKSEMIEYTNDYLEDKSLDLTEKQDNIEYVDPMEAYIDLMTARTSYMAAIQIGTNMIQPTILDFMN